MQKKKFTVRITRTIKEYADIEVETTSAQKAKTIVEFQAESFAENYDWQDLPDSLPGKVVAKVIE